jgi:hypothetical protein
MRTACGRVGHADQYPRTNLHLYCPGTCLVHPEPIASEHVEPVPEVTDTQAPAIIAMRFRSRLAFRATARAVPLRVIHAPLPLIVSIGASTGARANRSTVRALRENVRSLPDTRTYAATLLAENRVCAGLRLVQYRFDPLPIPPGHRRRCRTGQKAAFFRHRAALMLPCRGAERNIKLASAQGTGETIRIWATGASAHHALLRGLLS